jgi:bifunctional enzyme CysN/CysC
MRVEEIHRVMDASELVAAEDRERVERHEVAECTLALSRPLAFDPAHALEGTSRFVIVDDYEISGGGIIRDGLRDDQTWVRGKVLQRNLKWSAGGVGPERRAERFSQQPALLLITGERDADRKGLARGLESRLFDEGRFVYMVTIGNVLYGVDADLERTDTNRTEHIRRLGEVANLLLDAGLIVIATAIGLTQAELELLRTAVGRDRVSAAWLGDQSTDIVADVTLTAREAGEEGVGRLKDLLQKRGVIFKPW